MKLPVPSSSLLSSLLLLLASSGTDNKHPHVMVMVNAQTSNAGTMDNDSRLTKLAQLLDRTGISPSIAATFFAPTTDAWNAWRALDEDLFDKYTTQPEFFVHLRELLLWHLVTEGAFTTDEIFNGNREFLENSMGNITIDQRFKKVDDVALISFQEPNITTTDGIMHVLDQIIVPPYMAVNMIEHMLKRDISVMFAYSTMANLALYAELDDKINAMYEHGLTFLVPPNRRFNRAQIDVPQLMTPAMKEYTTDFVLAHLIMDVYYEAGVFAFNQENNQEQFLVKSELGTHLWITTTDNRLRFQSRELILTDQVARNGIFQVMDLPVYPPFVSDFTELMHVSTTWNTRTCFELFDQAGLSSQDISRMFNSTVTLLCPSFDAWSTSFNREDLNRLLEPIWVRHATELLLNHMTIPAMTREEMLNRAPSMITMLNGAEYELRMSGDQPRIKSGTNNQARSDFGDIIALDGYLHMLDAAITPTAVSMSIYDKSNDDPNFSLLVENIDFVQLTDLVDRDLPLTMLAPDNTAFRRVTFGTLDGADILKRHIFKGLQFCDVIANSTELKTVEEEFLPVELRGPPGSGLWGLNGGQNLYVGGAYLYECDIYAWNGVLHHIDRVIGLDYETVSPTISPAPTITARPTVYVEPTAAPVDIPTGFAPIVLPPILPGVVPSAKTDDGGGGTPPAASSAARVVMGRAGCGGGGGRPTMMWWVGLLSMGWVVMLAAAGGGGGGGGGL